jgi:bacillithiol system protein YtxJ
MHWIHLTDEDQLQKIVVRSQEKPQVIFKYSSCCDLSETIFQRLQKKRCPQHVDFHFLDLSGHANISEKVSTIFQVSDLSPQILIIKDGECIFNESHSEICLEQIMEHVTATA